MPVITFAGENLIAQQQQAGQNLIIDKMILANISGLDDSLTPDRGEALPIEADIKLRQPITKDAMLNSNTVVYSSVFVSTQGTFDFNWMGLYSTEHDVLVAVAYVPLQSKIATLGPVIGNVITKNFAIEFNGAAALAGINIAAESWQIDYTARLLSTDKIQRDMIKNIYGPSTYLNDAFKIKYENSNYYLSQGKAILGGLINELTLDLDITPGALPQTVWLDVYQETSMVGVINKFDVVFNGGSTISDYTAAGVDHSFVRIGTINSQTNMVDERANVSGDLSPMSKSGGVFTGDVAFQNGSKLDAELYDNGNRVWSAGNLRPIKGFKNIANAKADAGLVLGDRVDTFSYRLESGIGGGEYIVVAGNTGTDNGGLYHDTVGGFQLKLIIRDWADPKKFGAYANGVNDDTTSIQNCVNAFDTMFSKGDYWVSETVTIPDNRIVSGINSSAVTIIVADTFIIQSPVFTNENVDNVDGSLGAPNIQILNLGIDGSRRVFPAWLSKADGTPITDPEADYRLGGVLAPALIELAAPVISDGVITGVIVTTSGSGYTNFPVVWITGNGTGARIEAVISGGVITGYTIGDGGEGYTTATLEIAGGGSDPKTALYAADRRNPNYHWIGVLIALNKCEKPVVSGCKFFGHGSTVISDAGCNNARIDDNEFIDIGKIDFVGNCLWSQSYGSVKAPGADFRLSTGCKFINNTVENCKRSVNLVGGEGHQAYGNTIDGWGESCFFVTDSASDYSIHDNNAKNGVITDIVCFFVEGTEDLKANHNVVENVDGPFFSAIGDSCSIIDNTLRAGLAIESIYPFGPFSERVGYNAGSAPVAGANRIVEVQSAVFVTDVDANPLNAPRGSRIVHNTIIDELGAYKYFLNFSKGAAKSVGSVLLEGNDIEQAPSIEMFNAVAADTVLDPNKPFRVINNPGHVSMGAVGLHVTIPIGTQAGSMKFTFGFRPRMIQVLARANYGGQVAETTTIFIDEESRNPGAFGASNSTGFHRLSAVSDAGQTSMSENQGGIRVKTTADTILNASALGFHSDGWSINIISDVTVANVVMSLIATP